MTEIISKHTRMTAETAADGMRVKRDHVYVIPPGVYLQISDGVLHLSKPEVARGARMPIDLFFRSLAEDLEQQAVCIVLSGTGSDGTLVLRAVKEKGAGDRPEPAGGLLRRHAAQRRRHRRGRSGAFRPGHARGHSELFPATAHQLLTHFI